MKEDLNDETFHVQELEETILSGKQFIPIWFINSMQFLSKSQENFL